MAAGYELDFGGRCEIVHHARRNLTAGRRKGIAAHDQSLLLLRALMLLSRGHLPATAARHPPLVVDGVIDLGRASSMVCTLRSGGNITLAVEWRAG